MASLKRRRPPPSDDAGDGLEEARSAKRFNKYDTSGGSLSRRTASISTECLDCQLAINELPHLARLKARSLGLWRLT
jgi:hypothetical protein